MTQKKFLILSLLFIIFGLIIRLFTFSLSSIPSITYQLLPNLFAGLNINNLGFSYDTVTTQFAWGRDASSMGVFNFWQNYSTSFDYPFFALCYDILIYKLSTLIGGTEQSFVIMMKSINFILDISFAIFLYNFLISKIKFKKNISLLISSMVFALPVSWFVTAIWGQFDIWLILGSFWACCTLISLSSNYSVESGEVYKFFKVWKYEIKYKYLLAMFVLAICFWTKMNTIFILLPALLILQKVDKFEFKKFIVVFSIISFILNIIPFALNPLRFVMNGYLGGSRNISNGADVFWTIFTTDNNYLRLLTILGVLILISIIVFLYKKLRTLTIDSENVFQIFLYVLSIFSLSYFVFSTSMHSRYSYIGILFASILMMINYYKTNSVNLKIILVLLILLGNFAFLQNNSSVYASWNYVPDYRLFTFAMSGVINSLIYLSVLIFTIFSFNKLRI